jgi:pimeloyl-ACP methyl ester carboxylesterase
LLLDAAGEKGPYVLVGHSFGGYNVRCFAGLYPAAVAGMVLVDASHPDEERLTDEVLSPAQRSQEKEIERRREFWDRISAPLALHLGIRRFTVAAGLEHSHVPKRIQEEFLFLEQQPDFWKTIRAEDEQDGTSGAQAAASGNLGDRPLIVLTAGRPYEPDPLLTPEQMKRQSDLWINVMQAEEARLSTRGRQVVVPDSGHDIPQERPGAIVEAIRDVWNAVRQPVN